MSRSPGPERTAGDGEVPGRPGGRRRRAPQPAVGRVRRQADPWCCTSTARPSTTTRGLPAAGPRPGALKITGIGTRAACVQLMSRFWRSQERGPGSRRSRSPSLPAGHRVARSRNIEPSCRVSAVSDAVSGFCVRWTPRMSSSPATPDHDGAGRSRAVVAAWPTGHGDVDDVRRPVAHPVPVGRRRPRDRGTVTCPQRRRTHPRLVPEPMPTHQIGPGMQARPHSITRPPVDSGGGHPAAHGLRQRDHPGLPRHQRLEGHRPSMTDTHDSRGRSGQADAMISA